MKFVKGRKYLCIESNSSFFKTGKIYKCLEDSYLMCEGGSIFKNCMFHEDKALCLGKFRRYSNKRKNYHEPSKIGEKI